MDLKHHSESMDLLHKLFCFHEERQTENIKLDFTPPSLSHDIALFLCDQIVDLRKKIDSLTKQ